MPDSTFDSTADDASTSLILSENHREYLLNAAISPEVLSASGIVTATHPTLGTCIRFPWNDGGEDVHQFRPDNPPTEGLKYKGPKGRPMPVNHIRVGDQYKRLILCEGTKQSYAVASWAPAEYAVYGMAGCDGWQKNDLSFAYGMDCFVLLDADWKSNPSVWRAARDLKEELDDAGANSVQFVRSIGTGKDGADDVLADTDEAARADLVKTWLSRATPKLGKRPRDLKAEARKAEAAKALKAQDAPVHDAAALADMPGDFVLSDALMAERVASEAMTGNICFSPELGWLQWNGKVWARVDESAAVEMVRGYLRKFVAAQVEQPTIRTNPKELMGLLSRPRVNNILSLTKGLVSVAGDRFDADPDVLTVDNGVVDLRTGQLRTHNPDDYFTTFVPTAYRHGFTHEDVTTALTSMDAQVRDYIRVCLGQGITGHMPDDDRIRLLHGGGSNGKSVVTTGLTATLGTGKAGGIRQLSDDVLIGNKDAKEEKMALRGARLTFVEELPEGAHLNVNQLKKTVGTPTITSRHLYRGEVTWRASHTLILTTNYKPTVAETDHGTWRRLALIPFPYTYTTGDADAPHKRKGDPLLRGRMEGQQQREAMLSWLVSGAIDWYRAGRVLPQPPADVVAATDAWRGESDMVVRYWSERLVFDADSHVMANDLSDDLNAFLEANGKSKWGSGIVASRFGDHDKTAGHGVEKRQISKNDKLSRPDGATRPVSARYMAWTGVRFATSDDFDSATATTKPDQPQQAGTANGVPVPEATQVFSRIREALATGVPVTPPEPEPKAESDPFQAPGGTDPWAEFHKSA